MRRAMLIAIIALAGCGAAPVKPLATACGVARAACAVVDTACAAAVATEGGESP